MSFLGCGDFRAEETRACSEAEEMEPEGRKKAEIQGRARTVIDHVLLRGWTGLHRVGSNIARGGLPLSLGVGSRALFGDADRSIGDRRRKFCPH